ncbi:MAG: succinyldiaminopimelate transaminase [Neisseria sp.]|nr:succinyldiaminopimelate transaminase [Neisseria sp.]
MNPFLDQLQPYPFARLREALEGIAPPPGLSPVMLQIGEPKHPAPAVITQALARASAEFDKYPQTAGLPELRRACAAWAAKRYDGLQLDPDTEILPVLGSREALFSFAQTILDPRKPDSLVAAPNPFYQIYEGAALLGGAQIRFAGCRAPRFLPDWNDIPAEAWPRVKLLFACSPHNPTGAVMNLDDWAELFSLQDKHGFVIASDECYSEIYFAGNKPLGALQAAEKLGRSRKGLVMFTSLSKRSNVPGLRSGFVAGDADLLRPFLLYRTYHGSAMGIPVQRASIAAWEDEAHVEANRSLYQAKFDQILPILRPVFETAMPEASFYIWLKVPDGDDLAFARRLWREAAVQVLPGRFLARDSEKGNPGQGYVRIALTASLEDCLTGAGRMADLFATK